MRRKFEPRATAGCSAVNCAQRRRHDAAGSVGASVNSLVLEWSEGPLSACARASVQRTGTAGRCPARSQPLPPTRQAFTFTFTATAPYRAARMTDGGITRVVYLGTAEATRVVASQADKFIFRDQRPRLITLPTFDDRGRWVGREAQLWDTMTDPVAATGKLPTPQLWDAQVTQ